MVYHKDLGGGDLHPSKPHTHPGGEITSPVGDSAKLEGKTKAEVQDHAPKAHTHLQAQITDIGGTYHSRLIGNIQAGIADFGFADFICDGSPHELDLSSIIPVGTKAVVVNGRWWVSALDDMMDLLDCSDIGDASFGDIAVPGDSGSGYMVFNVVYPVTADRKLLYLFACTILDTFDCGLSITGYFK